MKTIEEKFAEALNPERRKQVLSDPNRLTYHIMPPAGWLNDPNGLYQKDGVYHIFYQFAPEKAEGTSLKGWGHYSTKDFEHFKEEDIAIYPNQFMDGKGAYSGSAFPWKDDVHFFYTGNNKLDGDYDYINEGRIHWVNHFTTKDGQSFTEKETLLTNDDYGEDMSNHVRDPKIIEQDGKFYMVLGARSRDSEGQVLVFESEDLHDWKPSSRITSKEEFGYVWECPDVFDLSEERFLITCPQGVPTEGIKYENIYQNGYFKLNKDLEKDQVVDDFVELDHGFDFYAPQSFLDEKGRRILIGWLGIPDADYDNNPTVEFGWQHALTLPRLLTNHEGKIYQYPIEETLKLRQEEIPLNLVKDEPVSIDSIACEIQLQILNQPFVLKLRKDAVLSWDGKVVTLKLGQSGQGRDVRHLEMGRIETVSIFSDTSSMEIFFNQGEEAMSTRLYDQQNAFVLEADRNMQGTAYLLKGYEFEYKEPEADEL